MGGLPTGQAVTFLFTDIEGSTRRWEQHPAQMRAALTTHNEIIRAAYERNGGVLYETAGDSFIVTFHDAPAALRTALEAQRALLEQKWAPEIDPLRVRMALRTGSAEMRSDRYDAQHTLSRHSRMLAATHGGQILVSSTTQQLVTSELPDGVELTDLGELVLRDLVDTEHVFQVTATTPPWSLPADFPPLRADRVRLQNAPTEGLPFVGRHRELKQLVKKLVEPGAQLVSLLGPGGVGKTRLAIRAGELAQHRFPDGAYFINLAPITDPSLVTQTIAEALGVGADQEQGVAAALDAHLGTRRLLLVLDNFEQVSSAGTDIERLLTAAPGVCVLVTSRLPLRLEAERRHEVAPLQLPEVGTADVDALAQVDAVALFVERARVARHDFMLTASNAAAVAAICRRLDGIPLALLLAAARSEILSPEQLLDRLDRRLAVLTRGSKSLPARQQTLRGTLEWSYELLDETERLQYALSSVFSGGFQLDAVEAVAAAAGIDPIDVLDGTSTLVDHHLLTAQHGDTAVRFGMLETIREHAAEKLDELGASRAARHAHARHFQAFAGTAADHYFDEHAIEWFGRLSTEHDNLRSAISWTFEGAADGDSDLGETSMDIVVSLAMFWIEHSHLDEGWRTLERALELLPSWTTASDHDQHDPVAEARVAEVHYALGCIAIRRGRCDEALTRLLAALEMHERLGNTKGTTSALMSLGTASFTLNDFETARGYYTRGLDKALETNNGYDAITALIGLGNIERDTDSPEAARSHYEHALRLSVDEHDYVGESVALNNLANLAFDVDDHATAQEIHHRSLELRLRIGQRLMVAESLVGLAAIAAAGGHQHRAGQLLGHAVELAEQLGGHFDPCEQRLHDATVDNLRTTLGVDALDDLMRAGAALGTDAAVSLALAGTPISPQTEARS